MKLRDIVNRDLVTLTNCESEPIHIPGAIQPHGFLIGVAKGDDLKIDFCSANSGDFCGASHEQLLGKRFAAAFGETQEATLRSYVEEEGLSGGNPISLELGGTAYSCSIRRSGEHYLLEAEPFPDGFRTLPDLYKQTSKFVSMIARTQTLRELCQAIAEETREVTGYDRVMIYRFDSEYNGEVFAEARRDDLEPFLNLHYPHTDIPAQARELYLRNLLRMIADVHYTPVPIFTIDDAPGKNLDLSHSMLRSVSPIHIQYLKNMGVGATLTVSLIHEHRLWGLIACHHYSPKNIPHYTRLSAQLHGHFLASQIAVREVSEAFEAGKGISLALERLLQRTTSLSEEDLPALLSRPELLQITQAAGVAVMFNGQLYLNGQLPEQSRIAAVGEWLSAAYPGRHFSTSQLSAFYPAAASQDFGAAGLIYHSLAAGSPQYIIWFRKEQATEVLWAGDPSKAIVKDKNGLSPRKSFEQWIERTSLQSKEWSDAEQAAAANFAHALQRQLGFILLTAEEERYRKLSERLQQANAELENINWISTHDLQEPLRKIQVFASRILSTANTSATGPEVLHDVRRMHDAANRMQALVTDIHSFSKVNHLEAVLKPVALDHVLQEVLRDLSEELADKEATVALGALPVINGEPFLLRQLFTNILRNALKFSRAGRPTHIDISAGSGHDAGKTQVPARAEGYHLVTVADNGIGFSEDHAEAIFGLFRRLHGQQSYSGTGIGLALCRKIMQHHAGLITAEGKPEAGATFYLWFPRSATEG